MPFTSSSTSRSTDASVCIAELFEYLSLRGVDDPCDFAMVLYPSFMSCCSFRIAKTTITASKAFRPSKCQNSSKHRECGKSQLQKYEYGDS